ncbi:hypothetical protein QW131_28295 [Roseibium salinum]|nr:hypothetical protein [Roseibium salinum]
MASVVAEVERLQPTGTAEDVAKEAAELARPFYEQKISKVQGPEPSNFKDSEVKREVGRLATSIRLALLESTPYDRIRNVTAQAREKMLDPGLYGLTRYHIHAAAWIAQHPQLELAPSGGWDARVEAIAAASPFANLSKRRRELDRVIRAMPGDTEIAVASAMAMLARPGCDGPFLEDLEKRVDLSPRYQEAYLAGTSGGDILLCKTANRVVLHEVKENWRFGVAKKAARAMFKLGMVHEFDVLGWPKPIPFVRPPGTLLQTAVMGPIINWLRSFPARVAGKKVSAIAGLFPA